MRRAGHLVAGMLADVRAAIAPGVTTASLDALAESYLRDHGARSNFRGVPNPPFPSYPAVLCISVNDQIVHGIPGDLVIGEGDIVSVDGGCSVAGDDGRRWHGDSAFTVVVPPIAESDARLADVTEEAMWTAIAALAGARRVGAVGDAVETVVDAHAALGARFGIVEEFTGHGIGTEMHMEPTVLNYRTRGGGARARAGMALAVEPILTAGSPVTRTLADGWTVVTADGSRAAHWEHSVALWDGGVHVLTAPDGGAQGLAPYGVVPVAL